MKELNNIKPAPGNDQVYYPGQRSAEREKHRKKKALKLLIIFMNI